MRNTWNLLASDTEQECSWYPLSVGQPFAYLEVRWGARRCPLFGSMAVLLPVAPGSIQPTQQVLWVCITKHNLIPWAPPTKADESGEEKQDDSVTLSLLGREPSLKKCQTQLPKLPHGIQNKSHPVTEPVYLQ